MSGLVMGVLLSEGEEQASQVGEATLCALCALCAGGCRGFGAVRCCTDDKPRRDLWSQQNPDEADSLSKIHKDLDETKIILIDNIEQLMNRGEKLDDLVTKSEGLSSSAKMFYKQSRKANSCCIVM